MGGVCDKVGEEFNDILERHDINAKLLKLEGLIEEAKNPEKKVETEEATKPVEEEKFASSLPASVTPADCIRFNNYKKKMAEREVLMAEVAALEEGNKELSRRTEEGRKKIKLTMDEIEKAGEGMKKTADICTASSKAE